MSDNNSAHVSSAHVVSFDDEPLILVDHDDNVLGHKPKIACHQGAGVLHRAFSVFLFNDAGEVLLQQRSPQKQLWPGYWSNSCCSHPRRGETMDAAAKRRVQEELAITTPLTFLYRFEYQAQFGDVGAEHELCGVYVARSNEPIVVNPNEVSAWTFMAPEQLDAELAEHPDSYTPWLKLEWPRIRADHWPQVAAA